MGYFGYSGLSFWTTWLSSYVEDGTLKGPSALQRQLGGVCINDRGDMHYQ